MTKTEINQIKKWINALYSGEYAQTTGRLQRDNSYCCLGLACKLFIPDSKKNRDYYGVLYGSMPNSQNNAPTWLKGINMDFRGLTQKSIANLNDELKYSFEEIGMALQFVFIQAKLQNQ